MREFKIHQLNYTKSKLAAILSFAVIFLSGIYFLQPFTPDNSYAVTDTASGSYNGTTYSLTTTVSDLNLELHNVTPAGKAVYGKQTINVTTNAPGGYQLYMQTSGNLAGTKDGTATSDSIAAISSNNTTLDTNTWGYTKTTPNEDANTAAEQTIWNTPPSTLTQIDSTSSAATSGRDTDIYYGIKADNTLSGDNYSGTITYTTIANDAATDTLLTVSPTSGNAGTATTLTITTSLMTTSTGITASDISAKAGSYTCSSVSITSYAPLKFTCKTSTSLTAGTYTVSATISKYSKTYSKTSAYTAKESKYMQDFTTAKCNALTQWTNVDNPSGTTKTLYDKRDEKSYSVRRLADGNCWMVTNLAITDKAITTADSDSAGKFTVPASSGGSSSTSWSNSYSAAYMHIGSTSDSSNWTSNMGPYYNWYTATAGQGTQSTTGSVNYSICPKGWKLPYGDTSNYSWSKLYTSYGSTVARFQTATNTGSGYWSGVYGNGSLSNAGSYGYWWSRTVYPSNSYGTYTLSTHSGDVGPQGLSYKDYGRSVRCVLSST